MPYFSENDINEAKRRVQEMQSRARGLVDENENPPTGAENRSAAQSGRAKVESNADEQGFGKEKGEALPEQGNDKDDSSMIILALIMLLSREGADNILILALLYLLF